MGIYRPLIDYVRARKKNLLLTITLFISAGFLITPNFAMAYPIFAQQAYENPREATGRIVCANCHLAQKNVELELPKSALPNTVFEAKVKIPYPQEAKQILGNGGKAPLNVGAVIIFPEGFKLAPPNLLSNELKEKTKGVFIQSYSKNRENILVVGPMPGNKDREIIFPVLAPDPAVDKNAHFVKYPVYVGGNRGRGQLYPSGDKSNNNVYASNVSGQITKIENREKKGYQIEIKAANGEEIKQNLPPGLELVVTEGDMVQADQPLNVDPNVGGFGQGETEIVLQNPRRIVFMIVFFFSVVIGQTFLMLKKKQFEKVQAAEMKF